jgi:rhodanese-related sulfurtransferase
MGNVYELYPRAIRTGPNGSEFRFEFLANAREATFREDPMTVKTISPQELATKQKLGEPIELIDVRTPLEFQEVHCTFARNIPLSDLDAHKVIAQRPNANAPLYIICKSGSRGRDACEKFGATGYTVAVNVEGGTTAWADAGLPVNRGKKAISIERQVRIVAGSLIVLGVALSFVSPWFLGISALIGSGLVFAGVTDSCGMGLILARMPWNRAAPFRQQSN